ncbi:MAG: hypothetical protein HUU32_20030 [Calditrichaceae bacterium]|nr:hypothetical protein [Calditrichia bacterium]NUQ43687.1 hypothetical protein [Calditrichaceae bacterium]
MITAKKIAPLRRQPIDFDDTARLKAKLAQLRRKRKPLYLNAEEFQEILQWKLGQQIGRQQKRRAVNNEEIIRAVTGLSLTITHPDKEYELELRVNILCSLRGVGIPVASAILTLIFPDDYAVIDFRVWRQCFGENKSVFSLSDYKKYMQKIRHLASELDWSVQEVDHAIWEYDRRTNKRQE